jgi:hypothetical protein
MLLSSDWFLPYWPVVGLVLDDTKKVLLQRGCRQIVKQFMSGVEQYWLTDFSPERVAVTLSMFQDLAQKSEIAGAARDRLAILIGEKEEPTEVAENTQWLVVSITEEALAGSNTDRPLPSHLKQVLGEVPLKWAEYGLDSGTFSQACKNSTSPWDQYLSRSTPDLPCMLSDYAASLVSERRFITLWQIIKTRLTQHQQDELFAWYREVAQTQDGIELALPN